MTKSMVVKEKSELDVLRELGIDARAGLEDVNAEHLRLPYLTLLQGSSNAVKARKGNVGEFWDTLKNEVIKAPIEVVILGVEFGAAYFKQGEGLICKSRNGETSTRGDLCAKCPYNEYWGSYRNGVKTGCSRVATFLVVTRESLQEGGQPYPMFLNFSSTSFGIGEKLYSTVMFTGGPIFARSYTLGSEDKTLKNKNTIMAINVKQNPMLSKEELLRANEFYKSFAKKWKESDAIVGHDEEVTPQAEAQDDI